mgnify:FL=1
MKKFDAIRARLAANPHASYPELLEPWVEYVTWLVEVVDEIKKAFDRCESNRGAFSCHELHDLRCPKSRADSPEKWKGEWKCECGRERLDAALARLEELCD